jgi:hypothetical protein
VTDWIEINLPWDAETPDLPEEIDRKYKITDAEMRKMHGITLEEAYDAYLAADTKNVMWKMSDSLQEDFDRLGLRGEEHRAERVKMLFDTWSKKRGQKKTAEAWFKWSTVDDWVIAHPKTIALYDASDKWRAENKPLSFTGAGLNKPGTWIKMANGKIYLIGHINTDRGVCDDCTVFEADEIIVAYKPPTEEIPEP